MPWDFYFAITDGHPISIALDMDVQAVRDKGDKTTLLAIRIPLKSARADGLITAEESELLNVFCDALAGALEKHCAATTVGRVTGGGQRELFFYAPSDDNFEHAIGEVVGLAGPDGYDPGFFCKQDAVWDLYDGFLWPNPRQQQWMGDRRVVEALRDNGDQNDKPRPVEHFVHLPSREAAKSFAASVAEHGFEVVSEEEEPDEDLPIAIKLVGTSTVELPEIHGRACFLMEAAEALNGSYDGWGSPVTNDDA